MTDASPHVQCAAGEFIGAGLGTVDVFRGIRYAAPPIGGRRWRDPLPAPSVVGPIDATTFGGVAPQQINPALTLGPGARQDEDCLFLNVWRPAGASGRALPVMVWLHGGAYTFGSSSQPLYDGGALVESGDVVVVTVNYRIGALGFLDLSSFSTTDQQFDGNLALKDILLALHWVKDNIEDFGGDPSKVTVFGESAGGGLVTTLLATPSAAGLFSRAIAESSPATSVYGPARARSVAERFLREVGGDAASARSLPASEIVRAAMAVFAAVPTEVPGTLAFAPVIDGTLVPEAPATVLKEGRALPVPLIIGTNHDEASFFRFMKSPLMPITGPDIERMFAAMQVENPTVELPSREAVLASYEGVRQKMLGLGIARDIAFRLPTIWIAEGHAAVAPVWLYRFDHATRALQAIGLGATHGAELAYVWGNLPTGRKDPTFLLGGRRTAERISGRVRARWTAFARGGSPDAPDAVAWTPYDAHTRETLVIDADDRIVADLDAPLRAGWGDTVLAFP
ncbi:carboxylesterase/lipase family protein [Microbacterium rhizomatis]|uniref:Carboxylic ester hydrolase n=1 Tax=Microbacterium rhizomatis TaxID=1631477 RepID=A0A5J5J480_9MICO|nr:carboxylesterase/lipase family protein [Microbacterium rhizomatis]KAA9110871.1 carboxylesterase/lipase family protein [Microbacterium rhizomatis]